MPYERHPICPEHSSIKCPTAYSLTSNNRYQLPYEQDQLPYSSISRAARVCIRSKRKAKGASSHDWPARMLRYIAEGGHYVLIELTAQALLTAPESILDLYPP